MGAGLNLDLGDDLVLHDLGHYADESIASRLCAWARWLGTHRIGDSEIGQVFAVERSSAVIGDGRGQSTRFGPATNRVRAHAK
jgi:hypothetical protein